MIEPVSRTYRNPTEPVRDVARLLSRIGQVRRVMRGDSLGPAFRERLMLAVTAVNACRYCSYAHARQAFAEGVTPQEIEALARGAFDGCPSDELPALLYAQHWAEQGGEPDAAARARVRAHYGKERADAIELSLQIIRVGNLAGNTLDRVLHRLTRGRLGTETRRLPSHSKIDPAQAPERRASA